MPTPEIVPALAWSVLLAGPGLALQAPRLRPLTPRPLGEHELERVLGGLEALELERAAVDLFLVGDVDGDGLADLGVVDQAWRMCGNDPSDNRLRILSSASLVSLLETEGEELEAAFDPTAGLALEQDVEGFVSGRLDLGRDPRERDLATWSVDLHDGPFRRAFELAFVGDVDGDGTADLALLDPWASSPREDAADTMTGGLEVRSGADGGALWSAHGELHAGGFGMDACAAGDLDGDGRADVAVLASPVSLPGERSFVALLSGTDGSELGSIELPRGTSCRRIEPVDDFDGDGRPELLVRCTFGVGLPEVEQVEGFALLSSAARARLLPELPGEAAWVASTRGLSAAAREAVGAAVLGLDEPGGRKSLWSLGGQGPRRLRTLGPDEAAWRSVGPALTVEVGRPARPCVLLGFGGGGLFEREPRLLALPLGR